MMMKILFLFFLGIAFIQVEAQTDRAAIDSFEGSGNVDDPVLSDDEDFEGLLSSSGMLPDDEDESTTTTTETFTETTPDYEDEPEVALKEKAETEDDEKMTDEQYEDLDEDIDEKAAKFEDLEDEMEEEEDGMKSDEDEEKIEEIEEEMEKEEEEETMKEDIIKEALPEEPKIDEPIEPELTTTTKAISKEPKVPKVEESEKDNEETDDIDVDVDLAEKENIDKPPASSASIFGNNQFLVAIIIGGCIGLLFAVCVILLVVYRLKKKDEGSYALDEQKKLAPTSYPYTQGQEYFA